MKNTETILTIDDDKHMLKLNKDLLKYIGYKVYVANSGQEGLDIYEEKKNEIDLIILDMHMTGLSGSDTFDMLKEIDSNVKVLILSGYITNEESINIIERGCKGVIQKPALLEELSQKIREILEK